MRFASVRLPRFLYEVCEGLILQRLLCRLAKKSVCTVYQSLCFAKCMAKMVEA
jgi:hypothetical protein